MKKLVTLLLAAGLVCSSVAGAQALELKTTGQWIATASFYDNISGTPFMKHGDKSQHAIIQRLRTGLTFVASEDVSGTFLFQVGDFSWGGPNNIGETSGGQVGTRTSNLVTRLAFIDWKIPDTATQVRMGQQIFSTPSYTFTSPLMSDTATGISISGKPSDTVSVVGSWYRALSEDRINPVRDGNDTADAFNLSAEITLPGSGIKISPFGSYFFVGKDARNTPNTGFLTGGAMTDDATAYAIGFAVDVPQLPVLKPLRLTFDAFYSALQTDDADKGLATKGFYVAAGASYALPWGVPGLKLWYTSGDGDDIGNDGHGQPFFVRPTLFNATALYHDGFFGRPFYGSFDKGPGGTMGIQAMLNNLSFVEDKSLTHAFRLTYFVGTNDDAYMGGVFKTTKADGYGSLTTKDSMIEFDFDNRYRIYENLNAGLDFAVLIPQLDDEWGGGKQDQTGYRVALSFVYSW